MTIKKWPQKFSRMGFQGLGKLTIESWPKKIVGWIAKALETAKECGQFYVFLQFLPKVVERLSRPF